MNIWNSNPFQKKIFIIFLRILEPPLRTRFWRSMRQMDPTLDAFCLCHLPYVSVTLSEDGVKDLGYFTSWIFFFLGWRNKILHSHANASQKLLWRSLAFLLKFDQVLRLWIPALIASSVMWKIPNMQDVWCEGNPNATEFSIFKSVQRCNPYILFPWVLRRNINCSLAMKNLVNKSFVCLNLCDSYYNCVTRASLLLLKNLSSSIFACLPACLLGIGDNRPNLHFFQYIKA